MEMVVWHNAHWVSWGREEHFHNIFPALYEKLLPTSFARAKLMGWEGARWPKMTDTMTGRSSPGLINALLLWQQVCHHRVKLSREISDNPTATPNVHGDAGV